MLAVLDHHGRKANIMTVQPDYLVAELWRDYLSTAESIAAGVPADEVLPKTIMDSGVEGDNVRLVIIAKEEKSRGGMRRMKITPALVAWLKATTADAAAVVDQRTRQEASEMLRKIHQRLSDHEAFFGWLATLPLERRTGWVALEVPRVGGDMEPIRREGGEYIYGLSWIWPIAVF